MPIMYSPYMRFDADGYLLPSFLIGRVTRFKHSVMDVTLVHPK